MRAILRGVAILAVVLMSVSDARPEGAPGDVLSSFAAPCKYPAGMTSDGTHLYLVDWRTRDMLQVDPADGTVKQRWQAPTLKPQGIAWHGGLLYVCDDHTGRVQAWNPRENLVVHAFDAPDKRPSGLAFVEDRLYLLEKASGRIYQVNPEDGTIYGSYAVPRSACTCMTSDGRYLWVSDRIKDELYMVWPEDGTVVAIMAAPGPYPTGVAAHGGALWNVDFQTRRVYQLAVETKQPFRLSDTRRARVEYLWGLYNYGPGVVQNLSVNMAVPMELPNQKLLGDVEYSRTPTELTRDRWSQTCALFDVAEVAAGERFLLTWHVPAEVSAIRYLIRPEKVGSLAAVPAEIRQAYTVDGDRYRIDTPYIRETINQVVGEETNPYWIARKLYNFIIGELEYQMIGGWDVPEVVLKRGTGSCSEYTFAFIALCRAAGVPARYQGSIVVRGDDASVDEAFHRWAQVYLPNYGWVPVDANRGDAKAPADQARGFGELSNRFLITTQGGGNSEYLSWSYNSFATWQATGYCNVVEENFGFWEPLEEASEPAHKKDRTELGECKR